MAYFLRKSVNLSENSQRSRRDLHGGGKFSNMKTQRHHTKRDEFMEFMPRVFRTNSHFKGFKVADFP